MRRACIDIGSNTTRLLVADCPNGEIIRVHEERAFTHIGRDRLADGAIPPDKLARVAIVVARQLDTARRLGCSEVQAVATAAVRRAANGPQLAAAVREECGLEVRILSGAEEARLAFVGAAAQFDHAPAGEFGVVDVGGGSSELVVGRVPDQVRWSRSFPLGSGDLTGRFLQSDPPSSAELAAAREEVNATIGKPDLPQPDEAAAVGGSAASLARLAGRILDRAAFVRALGHLVGAPCHEVAQRFGLDAERVRLLPAGLLILEAASDRFKAPLVVTSGGLREGVLMEASLA